MMRAFRIFWWTWMEARACRKIRDHRIELTTWLIERDRFRHKLADARRASRPFNLSADATSHWRDDEA